jgi:hypothetical protein
MSEEYRLMPETTTTSAPPQAPLHLFEPSGAELRDQGMTAAEEAASEQWKRRVRYWINLMADYGEEFTAEDVRREAGEPPWASHINALGSLFHTAARRGIIERAGWTQAKRPSGHARALAVWRGAGRG